MKLTRSLIFVFALLLPSTTLAADPAVNEAAKEKLLDNARQNLSKASAETSVPADLSPAESTCGSTSATVTECRRAIREVHRNHDTAVKVRQEEQEQHSDISISHPAGYEIVRPKRRRPVQLPSKN